MPNKPSPRRRPEYSDAVSGTPRVKAILQYPPNLCEGPLYLKRHQTRRRLILAHLVLLTALLHAQKRFVHPSVNIGASLVK
jgi:hypothetical protein